MSVLMLISDRRNSRLSLISFTVTFWTLWVTTGWVFSPFPPFCPQRLLLALLSALRLEVIVFRFACGLVLIFRSRFRAVSPGVNDVRTFAVLVGDASFPVHGTAHCAAMVGAFFPDDSNLRGFQIRSVRHDDPDSRRVFAPPRSLHSHPGLPASGNLTSWRVPQEVPILPDVLPLLSLRTTDIMSACAVFAGPDAAGALLAFSFL